MPDYTIYELHCKVPPSLLPWCQPPLQKRTEVSYWLLSLHTVDSQGQDGEKSIEPDHAMNITFTLKAWSAPLIKTFFTNLKKGLGLIMKQ